MARETFDDEDDPWHTQFPTLANKSRMSVKSAIESARKADPEADEGESEEDLEAEYQRSIRARAAPPLRFKPNDRMPAGKDSLISNFDVVKEDAGSDAAPPPPFRQEYLQEYQRRRSELRDRGRNPDEIWRESGRLTSETMDALAKVHARDWDFWAYQLRLLDEKIGNKYRHQPLPHDAIVPLLKWMQRSGAPKEFLDRAQKEFLSQGKPDPALHHDEDDDWYERAFPDI